MKKRLYKDKNLDNSFFFRKFYVIIIIIIIIVIIIRVHQTPHDFFNFIVGTCLYFYFFPLTRRNYPTKFQKVYSSSRGSTEHLNFNQKDEK